MKKKNAEKFMLICDFPCWNQESLHQRNKSNGINNFEKMEDKKNHDKNTNEIFYIVVIFCWCCRCHQFGNEIHWLHVGRCAFCLNLVTIHILSICHMHSIKSCLYCSFFFHSVTSFYRTVSRRACMEFRTTTSFNHTS